MTMYERQKGICPICRAAGKNIKWSFEDMHATIKYLGARADIPHLKTVRCFAVNIILKNRIYKKIPTRSGFFAYLKLSPNRLY